MIVAFEDAKYKLLGMRESIEELGSALRIEETKELLFDLEAQTQAPDFWNSAEKSSKVRQTSKQGQDKVAGYEK
ncbi:MAG: peptide chain release factor 2, partial [Clostridia bacterium]|nr:peptide chain release factor 2 [Clostridia bacterium]